MEPAGAAAIVKKLYEQYRIRLIHYLGDGDSKGFGLASVVATGFGWVMTKLECVNHVAKRVGGRLRRRVTESKAVLVSGQASH